MANGNGPVQSWSQGLTGAARQVAETDDSPLRVLAGPGTGKTFALKRRVARLLENGVDASRLLVATFTRTAAIDLKAALIELGVEGSDRVQALTIHSFCFSLLSQADVLAATGRTPRPLMEFEQRFLIADLARDLGGVRECDRRLIAFNAAWARLQHEQPGWPPTAADRRFSQHLLDWLRFHEAMLIGEVVPETLRFIRNNPASEIHQRFDYILIDEYQDLNRAEQMIFDVLGQGRSMTVVGDEDQSIYSFKHAHPEGIRDFAATHPGTRDVQLADCRRCPRLIVRLANVLIQHNTDRAARILQVHAGNEQGVVRVVQWPGIDEEAEGIASFIAGAIDRGETTAGGVLVLAPRRQFGYAVRDALRTDGITAQSFFGEETLDDDAAQEAFTLLTLLAHPNDAVSLRCWCGFGSPSKRAGEWARVRHYCEEHDEPLTEVLTRLAEDDLTIPRVQGISERMRMLNVRLGHLSALVGQARIDALFPDGTEWAEPLRNAVAEMGNVEVDAARVWEHLRAAISQPDLPADTDFVRVMSLHKSKGLTADFVVVVGLIEGLIPFVPENLIGQQRAAALREQRRLFYVAITRARRQLILSSVTRLPWDIAHKMRVPVGNGGGGGARTITSTFVDELGAECPRAIRGADLP
jgi:superfamily I DNA/RNA helicase